MFRCFEEAAIGSREISRDFNNKKWPRPRKTRKYGHFIDLFAHFSFIIKEFKLIFFIIL